MAKLNTSTSVVDYLKSKGKDSSYSSRATLAKQYGITGYSGSSTQNSQLLSLLQKNTTPAAPPPAGGGNTYTPQPYPAPGSTLTGFYKPNPTASAATYGENSPAVLALQKSLNAKGANLTLDSRYGDLTKAAVAQYGGEGVPDYSGVNSIADANSAINEGQSADAASVTADGTPPVRQTTQQIMDDITKAVTPDTKKPKNPNYEDALTDYRTKYGVVDLETELDDLRGQARDITAQMQMQRGAERGKPVAMNVIEGRISQEEQVASERLTIVNNSIATVTDQLKTKYTLIDALMKTKEMDYTAAVTHYDKEMSTNISIFNAAKGIDEANKTEIDRAQDNARASAQIYLNGMTATGQTYDTLDEVSKTTLTKLGVQSGLGADFFSNVLKISAGKDILTTVKSNDDTSVSIIYKDGTVKKISTGLPASVPAGSKSTESEVKVFYKQSMEGELQKIADTNGYIEPAQWAKARQKWTANTPYTASVFDDTFRGYVYPARAGEYAGFETYKPGFIKKSTIELQAEGLLEE